MGVRIGAPSFLIRRTSLVSSYSRYGLRYERLQVIRKIPARDQAAEACLREPASQSPLREHRQPHAHHAGGWLLGVIDSNDFNLFTRCFRQRFPKERVHLLGMRCRGKSEGKDKYREDELLHVMPRFCPFGDVLRSPSGEDPKSKEISRQRPFQYLFLVYCSVEKLMHQRPNPIHFFFQREM